MRMTFGFIMSWLCLASVMSWAHPTVDADDESACARYLGNEGIMVSAGETKVLFDAFYSDSYGHYTLVPDTMRQALLNSEPPYDHVDALFVSHVHGDHFSAAPTLAYLRANPDVILYASEQVIEALGADEEAIIKRLRPIALAVGDEAQRFTLGDLEIDAVRIPHAGGMGRADIQNLAFRVSLEQDMTVLHLGDADPATELFAAHQEHWDAKPLQVAFPPYWFLGSAEGRSILERQLKAQRSIGIHVPTAAAQASDEWRQQHVNGGDVFIVPGEVRGLNSSTCAAAAVESR